MRIIKNADRMALAMAALCSLLCVQSGINAHNAFEEKIRLQKDETNAVRRWQASWEALKPIGAQWAKTFPPNTDKMDVLKLYTRLGSDPVGLLVNADQLSVTKEESIVRNGTDLGVRKYCLGTSSNDFVNVEAPNYAALIQGAKQLSSKPQVVIGGITVRQGNGNNMPSARLSNLCVFI